MDDLGRLAADLAAGRLSPAELAPALRRLSAALVELGRIADELRAELTAEVTGG